MAKKVAKKSNVKSQPIKGVMLSGSVTLSCGDVLSIEHCIDASNNDEFDLVGPIDVSVAYKDAQKLADFFQAIADEVG